MKKKGYALRDIARALDRSASTISDELRRNRVHGAYDPAKAEHKAYARRKYAKYQGKKIVECAGLRREVESRLLDDQSPQAVAEHIKRYERHLPPISKNAIYRFIASPYGRRIETRRWMRRQRRRRHPGKRKILKDRTMIGRRPGHINLRKRIGDAESDFIVSGRSGKGILLVVVDRRSRASFLERILVVTIPEVERAFRRIRRRFPEMRTVTTDNDLLLQKHKRLAALLGIRIFFCEAHHPWEKGTVENTNKVIRRDIPKGASIARYSKWFVQKLEAKLNRRPMECLDYRSPEMALKAYRKKIKNKKSPS